MQSEKYFRVSRKRENVDQFIAHSSIFQLISREPAGQHDVSEPQVQQRIRQGLRDARSQLLKAAYYEMLHDQSKIENFFAEEVFKNDAH